MIGITLTPEQIRAAPPSIRAWLEAQVTNTFCRETPDLPKSGGPALAPCSLGNARKVLWSILGSPHTTRVFFDLAQAPAAVTSGELRILRVSDMMRRCGLPTVRDVALALDTINDAFQHILEDDAANLATLDDAGYCFVPDETASVIQRLWNGMLERKRVEVKSETNTTSFTPYAISVPQPAVTTGRNHST